MPVNDPIADLLTTIRNGQSAKLAQVSCRTSRVRKELVRVLKDEGFIRDFRVEKEESGFSKIVIELKYFEGRPAIRRLTRISKSGRRVYSGVNDVPRISNGLGVSIVSTSKGIMSDHEARLQNVGGEVLCSVM